MIYPGSHKLDQRRPVDLVPDVEMKSAVARGRMRMMRCRKTSGYRHELGVRGRDLRRLRTQRTSEKDNLVLLVDRLVIDLLHPRPAHGAGFDYRMHVRWDFYLP